jgi:hypothetical protein
MSDYREARAQVILLLREIAAAGETVSYGDFGGMFREPIHHRNPMLYELLRDVCYEERQAGRPNLCALVVRKSDGMPGKGFFEYAALNGDEVFDPRAYWEKQVRICWDYYAAEAPAQEEDEA